MRLIDADALVKKFNEKASAAECLMEEKTAAKFRTFCLLADAVEQMPTVDAVPVVRCRDCKHSYEDLDGLCCSYGPSVDCVVSDFHFCANGERKEIGKDG